jgi:carotenoid cleavage dioxygenase
MEGKPLIAWEPNLGTHVGIVHRQTGEVRWFEGEACMAWHTMNAFNDKDRIVVDVCPQAAPMFPDAKGAPPDPSRAAQHLTRWEFNWSKPGAYTATRLHDAPCEYPRIDERHTGAQHSHGYLATAGGPGTADIFQRGLGHYDFTTHTFGAWHAGLHAAVGEPVFVPKYASASEGEGWLLTNVFDETTGTSHLAVLDAEGIERGPIARAHLSHHMPMGFHGCWIAADA